MRKRIAAIVALAFAVASAQWVLPVQGKVPSRLSKGDLSRLQIHYVPGEVLVQFRRDVSKQSRQRVMDAKGARTAARVGRTNVRVVKLRAGVSVSEAVRAFESSSFVRFAEPNLIRRVSETVPNDTNFASLWGLRNTGQAHPISNPPPPTASGTNDADIDASDAWDTQQGAATTIVAVLDTGIDVAHPDLDGSLWVNAGETPGNATDDDGNGYVDDVNGFDFADDDNTLLHNDPSIVGWDHGTHVSGTIAAEINNATGVAGVCPGCRIMTLKGFEPTDFDGNGTPDAMGLTLDNEIEALDYAEAMGAHILNGSYGGAIVTSKLQRQAFVDLGGAGVLAVLAAGNENGDNDTLNIFDFDQDGAPDWLSPAYPASYNVGQILAVAASNHNDELAYQTDCAIILGDPGWPCTFTNFGHDSVDVAAPGVDILSTVPGGGYATFDGTSMATPHTAGVAGLVKSQNPTFTPLQLKNAIMRSVNRPGALNSHGPFPNMVDTGVFVRSDGRINADAAIDETDTTSFPRTDGNINGARAITRTKRGTVAWPGDNNDVLKKRLVRGRRYRVTLTVPRNRDFDVFAYRPGTTDIWQVVPSCQILDGTRAGNCQMLFFLVRGTGQDEAKTFRVNKTGTYFFQISSFFTNGRYTFTARRL